MGPRADPPDAHAATWSRRRSSWSTRSRRSTPTTPAPTPHVIEELGDLLYHVEFHAAIAEQEGRFSIVDVTDGVHDKLVRRHPHVFGGVDVAASDEVLANWDADQAGREGAHVGVRRGPDVAAGARPTPPSSDARRPGSASTGPTSSGAVGQGRRGARRARRGARSATTRPRSPTSSATCCSPSSTSPGTSVSTPSWRCARAAGKFRRRFEAVEALAAGRGIDLRAADLATLDALWDEVKAGDVGMKLQLADPADHPDVGLLPFSTDLEDWRSPDMHASLGLHRHVVRLVEVGVDQRRDVLRRQGAARPPRPARVPDAARPGRGPPADRGGRGRRHRAHRATATACWSPATSTTRCPTGRCCPGRGLTSRTSASACSTPSSACSCACTSPGSSGATARCRTRCSGATPGRCRPTSSTSRRPSATRSSATGSAQFDLQIATENVAGGLLDLQAGRAPRRATSTRGSIASDIETRYEDAVARAHRRARSSTPTSCGASSSALRPAPRPRLRRRRDGACVADEATPSRAARPAGGRERLPPGPTGLAHRAVGGGEPGPPHARRTSATSAPSWPARHRRQPARERRRRALARPALRADDRRRPASSCVGKLQDAEIYHQYLEHRWFDVRARRPRRAAATRRWRRTSPRCCATRPTSRCASTRPPSCSSASGRSPTRGSRRCRSRSRRLTVGLPSRK